MEFAGVVLVIHARRSDVLFNVGVIPGKPASVAGNDSIRLQLDHPAYSAVYSLIMASFMNRKPLTLWIEPLAVNNETYLTVDWARL